MPEVRSVNVAAPRPAGWKRGVTGIDKRPVVGPVEIVVPAPGGSGVAGDVIGERRVHGGADQAVYAYAREDLDGWEVVLGRPLTSGSFGENLTTVGLDVTGARIGDRWRVGDEVVLQVTDPRIPCRTFATWLEEEGWIRRFTAAALPGAYLRVLVPGRVAPGDPVVVEPAAGHEVTVGLAFRALTEESELLPGLLACPDLTPGTRAKAEAGAERA